MKKLQNNFTTPEQSKRLLELGVPADSADLYTSLGFENLIWVRNTKNELSEDFFDALINGKSAHIPIWSAGRLMEIFDMCCIKEQSAKFGWSSYRKLYEGQTYTDYILYVFTISKMQDLLEFSKLDD